MSRELPDRDDIASFFDEGWISEVLFPVKSGKEATVYCCAADPCRDVRFYALKLYTPPEQRSFRNAAVYQETRFNRSTRQGRAMHNRSAKGRGMLHGQWLAHEYNALKTLFDAGCDVPQPIANGDRALLLSFIASSDDEGQAAPPLASLRFKVADAEPLFAQVQRNIETMLRCHLVHGDLSAYNILYGGEKLHLIDFPQAVDARSNSNARMLLERDVTNISRYFERMGCAVDPAAYATSLWERYQRAAL